MNSFVNLPELPNLDLPSGSSIGQEGGLVYVEFPEGIEYPQDLHEHSLFLKERPDGSFAIPDNSIGLAQILNESEGGLLADGGVGDLIGLVFKGLKTDLVDYAARNGSLPERIDYHQVAIAKDTLAAFVLPPFTLVESSDPPLNSKQLINSIGQTIVRSAHEGRQLDIAQFVEQTIIGADQA